MLLCIWHDKQVSPYMAVKVTESKKLIFGKFENFVWFSTRMLVFFNCN